jgi:hypothetical protein
MDGKGKVYMLSFQYNVENYLIRMQRQGARGRKLGAWFDLLTHILVLQLTNRGKGQGARSRE